MSERRPFRTVEEALHVGHVLVTGPSFQNYFLAEDIDRPGHWMAHVLHVSRIFRGPPIERGVISKLKLRNVVVLETVHSDIRLHC
jgi:hypothetical protein